MNKKILILIIIIISLSSFVTATLNDDIANNINYYKLDINSANQIDSVGNNNGTIVGGTYNASGLINGAYSFDNDYLTIGKKHTATDQSISFWLRNNVERSAYLFTSGGDSGSTKGMLVYQTSGIVNIYVSSGSSLSSPVVCGGDIADGSYHHVVITWDGTTDAGKLKCYIDNVQYNLTIGRTWIGDSNINYYFASKQDQTTGIDGDMDEISVWDIILSKELVSELYNSGSGVQYPYSAPAPESTGVSKGAISAYLYDGDLIDEVGRFNGTNNGTTNVSGYINDARQFVSASSQYIDNDDAGEVRTISFLLKPTNDMTNSTGDTIFTPTGPINYFATGSVSASLTDELFTLRTAVDKFVYWKASEVNNSKLTAGEWYHIVITFPTPAHAILYLDNTELTSYYFNSPTTQFDWNTFLVGKSVAGYGDFVMDELTIWNRTLSSSEVSDVYYNYLGDVQFPFIGNVNINIPVNNSYVNYDNVIINYTSEVVATCNLTRINNSIEYLLNTTVMYPNVPIIYNDDLTIDDEYEYQVICSNNKTTNSIVTRDTIPPTLSFIYIDINTDLKLNYNVMIYSNRTLWTYCGQTCGDSWYFDDTYLDLADNNYRIRTNDVNYDYISYTTTNDGSGNITVTSSAFIDYVSIDYTLASDLSKNYINATVYDLAGNSNSGSFYYYKPKITYSIPTKKHFLAGTVNFFNVSFEANIDDLIWGDSISRFYKYFRYIVNGTYYNLTLVSDDSNSTYYNYSYKAEKTYSVNESPAVIPLNVSSQIDIVNSIGGPVLYTSYGSPSLEVYNQMYTISDIDIGICGSQSWLTYPWLNLTFRDEQNDSLINISLSYDIILKDDLFTINEQGSINNNNLSFCTNIDPNNFTRTFNLYGELIVSKPDYVTRVFKLNEDLNINGSNNDITQYPLYLPLIESSTSIFFTWKTKEYQLIDGTMYVYKCNGNNSKILIDATSISGGQASSNLQLLTTAYSYEVLYDGVLYNTESYTDCHVESTTTKIYYIDVIKQVISPVLGLFFIDCSVTKQSNTTVSMTWGTNEENLDDEITGCLDAYYTTLSGRVLYDSVCNNDEYIFKNYTNTGQELIIIGSVIQINGDINATGYCQNEITLFNDNSNIKVWGKLTLFFVIVIVLSLALLFANDGIVILFVSAFGIIIAYLLGFLILPKTAIISIMFFFFCVALVGGYFRKK